MSIFKKIKFLLVFVMLGSVKNQFQVLCASSPLDSELSPASRAMIKVYDECSHAEFGFVSCLKKKSITFIDRISALEAITVSEGVRIIRLPDAKPVGKSLTENDLESTLPRTIEDRDGKLTSMLFDRLSRYFNGHTIMINFPKMSSEEIGRGLEEGRGKMKKMMGMMMMGMAMKLMGMIPVAMGFLYILSGKALIVSKIALLLAGIMVLKKLMSSKGGGGGSSGWSSGGGGGGGWSSGGGGGGGGGWDRRSLNDSHDIVYKAYKSQTPNDAV